MLTDGLCQRVILFSVLATWYVEANMAQLQVQSPSGPPLGPWWIRIQQTFQTGLSSWYIFRQQDESFLTEESQQIQSSATDQASKPIQRSDYGVHDVYIDVPFLNTETTQQVQRDRSSSLSRLKSQSALSIVIIWMVSILLAKWIQVNQLQLWMSVNDICDRSKCPKSSKRKQNEPSSKSLNLSGAHLDVNENISLCMRETIGTATTLTESYAKIIRGYMKAINGETLLQYSESAKFGEDSILVSATTDTALKQTNLFVNNKDCEFSVFCFSKASLGSTNFHGLQNELWKLVLMPF
uniref:Uncharacterized protein n=1 Tax=Arion vulgaris TaxID=1028688 RepID=A0A0B7A7F8_9EUPU